MQPDTPTHWPTLSREVLGRGAISSFVNEVVRTPTGTTMNRQFLTHPGAVAVVAWDEEADTILTLRQYRHPVRMTLAEIPAGLLDVEGEGYVGAAARELAEEAELGARRWNVLVDIFSTPGACEETLRVFLARDLFAAPRPDGFVLEDEEAQMSLEFVPRADLVDAVLGGLSESPSLVTGVLALETARLSGRLESLRGADAPWIGRGSGARGN